MNVRIIPRLDIKGQNLVKGIQFEGLRIIGKPEKFASSYYKLGADELIYMDIVASLYGRNNLLDIVSRTSKDIFIPLTVGGGLRSIDDISNVLNAGADKVALNTAVIKNPNLIKKASRKFGSSTIIVSIEAKKINDNYEAYIDNGREKTGVNAIDWAIEAEKLGAGEIMITCVDRDGTGKGFDTNLSNTISKLLSIPLICGGGAGSVMHVKELIKLSSPNAVCIGSLFHYESMTKKKKDESAFTNPLLMQRGFTNISPISIKDLKTQLIAEKIKVRSV